MLILLRHFVADPLLWQSINDKNRVNPVTRLFRTGERIKVFIYTPFQVRKFISYGILNLFPLDFPLTR
jgi:hypothetical protein